MERIYNKIKNICIAISSIIIIVATISCNKDKILSPDKLAKVISDIYLADQYAKTYESINKQADTSLLYQAVFELNGCTLEEYYRSVEYYLSQDNKYPEIIDKAFEIIKIEYNELSSQVTSDEYNLITPPLKYVELKSEEDDDDCIFKNVHYTEYKKFVSGLKKNHLIYLTGINPNLIKTNSLLNNETPIKNEEDETDNRLFKDEGEINDIDSKEEEKILNIINEELEKSKQTHYKK